MLLLLVMVAGSNHALAQISTPPATSAEHINGIGGGLSYGEQNDRNATFWGWSLEYSRFLTEDWSWALSVTWDEETESFSDKPDKVISTYTAVATITYGLTDRFSLTTGLGKGFANDDNPDRKTQFTSGDWGTGVALGYTVPLGGPRSLAASLAYEYNLSERETSLSVDLALGWSF